jgi:signal peptide peptidase SppA
MSETEEAIAEFKRLMAEPAARQAFVELKRAKDDQDVGARYQHVFKAVFGSPWALYEPYMELIANLLVDRAMSMRMDAEEMAERLEAARRPTRPPAPHGVAVLPLHGVIVPKASMFSEMSGATSIEGFRSMLREALGSKEVASIVLDVDSPGGSVEQVPEMAAELRAARGTKPITAVANGLMASAAYWLASQADEIVATKSALVGSIGVVTAHEDISKAAEQKGLKVSLVSAGKFKTDGNPFEPLSDEHRAHVQAMVDEFYGMFVGDVAKGRHVPVDAVRSGFGEGRVVSASMGLKEGMIDRIGSLEGVIGQHLSTRGESSAAADADADALYFVAGAGLEPGVAAEAMRDIEQSASQGADVCLHCHQPVVLMDGKWAVVADAWGYRCPRSDFGHEVRIAAAVDNSPWDGNRAMGQCETASDYRSICAGEKTVGEPDERQHWALPHHYLGKGPNAAGTRNALSRLPQTQNLKNREGAQRHLDAHMREINPESSAETDDIATAVALLRDDPVPASF